MTRAGAIPTGLLSPPGLRTEKGFWRAARTLAVLAIFAAACGGLGLMGGWVLRSPVERPAPAPLKAPASTAGVDRMTLTPGRLADLPGWAGDAVADALPALSRSCERLLQLPAGRPIGRNGIAGTAADWQAPCRDLAASGEVAEVGARRFFEAWFAPFLVADRGDPEGLFTGYYEAELRGARRPDRRFHVPLYRRPPTLITVDLGQFRRELAGRRIAGKVTGRRLQPFDNRTAIEGGALAGRGLELLWVDDAVDAFFLHVQGSGRVLMEDGSVVRVGYDGSNDLPFVAIGRALLEDGLIDPGQATMQGIRGWLTANPERGRQIMARNGRFVFFRELHGDGPIGSQGVALTPGRSLAVDPAFLPLGAPLWLDTHWPGEPGRPLRRLVVAQDSGAAIKGPVRGDLFWGFGDPALRQAGRMKSPGRLHLLLPRALAARLPTPR
ncbi:MAG: murein transglycosylase A [Kiloniellales bacterium]